MPSQEKWVKGLWPWKHLSILIVLWTTWGGLKKSYQAISPIDPDLIGHRGILSIVWGVYFVCVFCSVLKFLRQFYLVNNIENQWSRLVATCLIFVLVNQSCPTLRDSIDYSPPGSSVHGILQARILEWVAISFSRGSSWPRDWTQLSFIAGRFFTVWATHTH